MSVRFARRAQGAAPPQVWVVALEPRAHGLDEYRISMYVVFISAERRVFYCPPTPSPGSSLTGLVRVPGMTQTGSEYARSFLMHRNALLSLLERIPADKADFKAWEGGMSFKHLSDHLSGSAARMAAMLRGQTPEKLEPSADWAGALERMRASTSAAAAMLETLNADALNRVVPAFGTQMPVRGMVDFLIQHEAHHKGQVWMMARMIGLEPPMFVKLG
jgi:uncharacterized damage-inducible protein DinB